MMSIININVIMTLIRLVVMINRIWRGWQTFSHFLRLPETEFSSGLHNNILSMFFISAVSAQV